MDSNLLGRLRKYKLSKNNALLPLFEAIVNSIHAIQELQESQGEIIISIDREETLVDTHEHLGNIIAFTIRDTGIGFTDKNFRAFNQLDTLNKSDYGGKGIGRLAWLKAFESVKVSSSYFDGQKFQMRKFDFNKNFEDGIGNIELSSCNEKTSFSTIILQKPLQYFLENFPKKADTIAQKIIEHCLYYFALGNIKFKLLDIQDESKNIDLKKLYEESYETETETIILDDRHFRLLKVFSKAGDNRILYCAHNRVVKEEKLSQYITELKSSLPNGKYIQYFVSSDFLDDAVNDERTDFLSPLLAENNINFDVISKNIVSHIDKSLNTEIEHQKTENRNYLKEYVRKEAPQYINILKYASEEQLRKIHKDMKSSQIEEELFHIKQSLEKEIKSESQKLETLEKKEVQYLVEKVTAVNSANLAEYIVYRKTIIETLIKYLRLDSDTLEDEIHQLIYPMRTTENQDYNDHNLWLIDDRLAFHTFCASDVQFKKFLDQSTNIDRPDILIFDKPLIYAPNKEHINSMVIIEFKRPKRNDYSLGKDPISQTLNYLEEISKTNQIIDNDNMTTTIHRNIQKQAYIIADITSSFDSILTRNYSWLQRSSDNTGFFGFDPGSKTYIEIISYEKLLKDSNNRNKIFFHKLGI